MEKRSSITWANPFQVLLHVQEDDSAPEAPPVGRVVVQAVLARVLSIPVLDIHVWGRRRLQTSAVSIPIP